MAAQPGSELLIKANTAASPSTYATIAGIQTETIALNATTIDTTSVDSTGRWRELLSSSGVRSCQVSGSGVFKDDASGEGLRKHFFDDTTPGLQLVIPDFGMIEGDFKISSLEYGAGHDGEVTFSITLDSAGALTFTAA